MDLATLLQEQDTLLARGTEIADLLRNPETPEDQAATLRTEFGTVDERLTALDAEVEAGRAEQAGFDRMAQRTEAARAAGRLAIHPGEGDPVRSPGGGNPADDAVSPGEIFLASDAWRAWNAKYPGGIPPMRTSDSSGSVQIASLRQILGLRTATEKFRGSLSPGAMRGLISSADASAGQLIRPEWMGLLEPGLVRPLTIRQLVTTIPVATNAVEWAREKSRSYAAGTVEDPTSATGVSGLKPGSDLEFEDQIEVIRTIAVWIAIHKNTLSDAPMLRSYIDAFLTDDVALELEDQMVAGSGVGELRGILEDPGIQTVDPPGGDRNMLDQIRTGKRLVQTVGRTRATAVLVNPEDAEEMDVLKFGTGATIHGYVGANPYAFGGGNQTVWALPVVESEAIPKGTGIVGDFRRAILFDRQDTSILIGTANDDFLRNIVRVLAEGRWGFVLPRPSAFVAVDLGTA